MSKFTVANRSDGQYYFNLKSDNGEVILSSEGYTSKSGCLNAIHVLKMNALLDQCYVRRLSSTGKHFFIFKSSNGEIIGVSEMYTSQTAREKGILAVKNSAPNAIISATIR